MSFTVHSGCLTKPQAATCSLFPRAQTQRLSGPSTSTSSCLGQTLKAQRPCRKQSRAARRAVSVVVAASKPHKVALLGAAGGIGQPLALLLKMQPYVTELALYDVINTKGVAADLSHCNTPVKVRGYTGDEELGACLMGADLVVIPAGVPRKPGMTRDDLFNINAGIVKTLAQACTQHCPLAIVAIISNPVNSTVPIAAEVFKANGTYDKRRVLGVTTLDVVRANTFVAEAKGLDIKDVDVPVVGGHAGTTILPLLSQASPKVEFSGDEEKAMVDKIQNAGTEVVEAKAGTGSATLSMAYAAARMAESILRGLDGEEGVFEAAYVESSVVPGLTYFASKVRLGTSGAEEVYGLRNLSPVEKKGVEELTPILKGNIDKGIEFAKSTPAEPEPQAVGKDAKK